VFYLLIITRDETTRKVTTFIDGVEQFSFIDVDNMAVFSNPDKIIHFLRDESQAAPAPPNTAGTEQAPGTVDFIRIYQSPISEDQVKFLAAGGKPPTTNSSVNAVPVSLTGTLDNGNASGQWYRFRTVSDTTASDFIQVLASDKSVDASRYLLADLYRADGTPIALGKSTIDLRRQRAGEFYLRV